jgi:very-short-patch-repair endonuclease
LLPIRRGVSRSLPDGISFRNVGELMPGFLKITVQKLRKNQTETEKVIWGIVRNRRLNGHKFLRQHSIRFNYYGKVLFFVADFYSAKLKLVIEIDGKIHENQQEYDQ